MRKLLYIIIPSLFFITCNDLNDQIEDVPQAWCYIVNETDANCNVNLDIKGVEDPPLWFGTAVAFDGIDFGIKANTTYNVQFLEVVEPHQDPRDYVTTIRAAVGDTAFITLVDGMLQ